MSLDLRDRVRDVPDFPSPATGGTARAKAELVERLGGVVAGVAFVIELTFLGGRERLDGYEVHSLLSY